MKYKKIIFTTLLASIVLSISFSLNGCDSKKGGRPVQTIQVSVYKPFRSDTPLTVEYAGVMMAQQKVPIRASISGAVTEKLVKGGDYVVKGEELYRIDARNYASGLVAAQAKSAQALASYENAKKDLERFAKLLESGAVSQKVYDGQKSTTEAYKAMYEAAESQVKMATNSMDDTVVKAPFSGMLFMDDIPVGTFVVAGQTPLVTISSIDPMVVQFQISEGEYLKWELENKGTEKRLLKLRLADGSVYEHLGEIVQLNSGMSGGQMMIKAEFPNPNHFLLPGMYASVISDSEYKKGCLLIPTKAIIQLLNKNMVDVVIDGKVKQKNIKIVGQYGIYTIVESGLDENDSIIVEGQHKVRVGQDVEVKELTKDEVEKGTVGNKE